MPKMLYTNILFEKFISFGEYLEVAQRLSLIESFNSIDISLLLEISMKTRQLHIIIDYLVIYDEKTIRIRFFPRLFFGNVLVFLVRF